DRLAHAPADVALAQENGVTSELGNGDVEGRARPQRLFLEDHGDRLVLEMPGPHAPLPVRLQLHGALEQTVESVLAQVSERRLVACGQCRHPQPGHLVAPSVDGSPLEPWLTVVTDARERRTSAQLITARCAARVAFRVGRPGPTSRSQHAEVPIDHAAADEQRYQTTQQ